MRDRRLVVDEVPDPVPGPGQVLVRTLACGICGSDLHALDHAEELVALSREQAAHAPAGMNLRVMDLAQDVVMGHEFSAEVLECGPGVDHLRPGQVVVSLPVAGDAEGMHPIGYSNRYPGGYGERMVLSGLLSLPVPGGLDPRLAALTEPMAVGLHAVRRSGITPGDSAVVLGCGPIGLAVIGALSAAGVEPVVAADFAPRRRELAVHMGAHEVVDPSDEPAVEAWRRVDGRRRLVIFEAVGVPGMIDAAMTAAPRDTRIVVVGVCMQPDTIRPLVGIGRELTLQFVLGYDPAEFAETLGLIADGTLDVAPLITGEVDLEGTPAAFEELRHPDRHAKILVRP